MLPPTDNDLSALSHTDTVGPSPVATAGPSRTFTEGRRPTFFSGSGKSSSGGPLISEPSVRQGNAAWLSVNADRCLRSNRYNRRASSSPSVSPGHPAFSRALFSLSSYAACRSCSQGDPRYTGRPRRLDVLQQETRRLGTVAAAARRSRPHLRRFRQWTDVAIILGVVTRPFRWRT